MFNCQINNSKFSAIQDLSEKLPRWIPISLIIINCILYEWAGVFQLEAFKPIVLVCKITIPLFLLLITFPENFHFPPLPRFINCFVIFMIWGAFSILVSSYLLEGITQWLKFFFRLLFCIAVCLYFIKRPISHQMIAMKVLVIIGVATVLQYFTLEMISFMGWGQTYIDIDIPQGGRFYGPSGVLGNGTAQFSAFYSVPKFQLTGFWSEPSNAAAFVFMTSFLAWGIYVASKKKIWMVASGVCCMGGILSFANGGYFAIGFALLIGHIINFIGGHKNRTELFLILLRAIKYHLLIGLSIFLILFAVFGRYVVLNYMPSNIPLKAITGIRGGLLIPEPRTTSSPQVTTLDATMLGRIELARGFLTEGAIFHHIVGNGFRIPGRDSDGRGVLVSASAPMMWLSFTGVVGLIILLLREAQVVISFGSRFPPSMFQLQIFQAWTVLFFQNMVYGTWMTPLYFLLIAFIFSSLYRDRTAIPSTS